MLRGFAGNLVQGVGSVRSLVQLGEAKVPVDFIVMKVNNLTQDCTIGGDFLNARDVMLIKPGGR
jgi:hypothetical protein